MAYLLYEKAYEDRIGAAGEVTVFTPKPGRLFLPAEPKSVKTAVVRLQFWCMTGGKAKLYYICGENDRVLHTSYVLPKCYKFPFMESGSYEIGPCRTEKAARGQGLYGRTLAHITTDPQYENARFYMIVEESNAPSIRGIEKAGFACVGKAEPTGILKRYRRTEDYK